MPVELNEHSLLADANLEAYYRFESGALTTDSSGDGETLTNNNTVGSGTGMFGGAADFGTANTNKYFNRASDLGITGGNITIMGWVKIRTEITSGHYCFWEQFDTGNEVAYYINYSYNVGTLRLFISRFRVGVSEAAVTHNVTLGTTNWYHIAMTYDGTNVEGFLNGSPIGTPAASSGNGAESGLADTVSIGADTLGAASNFSNAFIDDVAFFSRALTDAEILNYYNSSGSVTIIF